MRSLNYPGETVRMNSQTTSTRRVRGLRRAAIIRQLLLRDKTPLTILLLAALTAL